jgi:hypothetical protein
MRDWYIQDSDVAAAYFRELEERKKREAEDALKPKPALDFKDAVSIFDLVEPLCM